MKMIKTFEQFTESLKPKENYRPVTAMDSEEFNEKNNNEGSEPAVAESKKNDSEEQNTSEKNELYPKS